MEDNSSEFGEFVTQRIADNMSFGEALNMLELNDAFEYTDDIDNQFLKYETAEGTPIVADTYEKRFLTDSDYEAQVLDDSPVDIDDFQEMRSIVEGCVSNADTYMHFMENGDRRMYRKNRSWARTDMIAVAADGSGYLLVRGDSAGQIFDQYQAFGFEREPDGSVTRTAHGEETYFQKNQVPLSSDMTTNKLEFLYENVLKDWSDNPSGEYRTLHEHYRPSAEIKTLTVEHR